MLSIPFRSVTVLESHVRHAPRSLRLTTPSSNPRNSMSPPSSRIAGRIRVSSSSLIMATTSLSPSATARLSPSCRSPCWSAAAASPPRGRTTSTTGPPRATASVISENASGLTTAHPTPGSLLTVTKSRPTNTPVTPSTASSRPASSDRWCGPDTVARGVRYSTKGADSPAGSSGGGAAAEGSVEVGLNLRACGLSVRRRGGGGRGGGRQGLGSFRSG
jgi:hypothetical protein